MATFYRLLLLAIVFTAFGCGGVKKMLPDPDAKTWQEVVSVVAPTPVLRPSMAPVVLSSPVFLPMPPDAPSAADRAAQAGNRDNAYEQALRAAWKEMKANHVPVKVLTIAVQQAVQGGLISGLEMPPDPGRLDLSTGGLSALLLAIVAGLLKWLFAASSTSTKE